MYKKYGPRERTTKKTAKFQKYLLCYKWDRVSEGT